MKTKMKKSYSDTTNKNIIPGIFNSHPSKKTLHTADISCGADHDDFRSAKSLGVGNHCVESLKVGDHCGGSLRKAFPEDNKAKAADVDALCPGNNKFQYKLLLFILLFCGLAALLIKENAYHKQDIQKSIAEEIIRFHVIANSDTAEDQALKLTVKDTLVQNLAPILEKAETITEAQEILSDQLTYIKDLTEQTIQDNGYRYPVTVSLEQCYFPLKVYGDYTFPPGTYEALRVQIGNAEGKNWWCVMFPPLCFVDETYSIVDEKGGEKLKYLLTEEEYDTLINKKTPVKVKFKLFEAIKNLFK